MQIVTRYKDYPQKENIGIPVLLIRDDQQGNFPRYYVIHPVATETDAYCEVHIVLGEIEEWKIVGRDREFSTKPLKEDELLVAESSIGQDMYYVWDDGAKKHMERAQRIYQAFKSEIDKYDFS